MNGHRPRNFTRTKLLTSTMLTRISASSVIGYLYTRLLKKPAGADRVRDIHITRIKIADTVRSYARFKKQ
jgi:hypothetical protein